MLSFNKKIKLSLITFFVIPTRSHVILFLCCYQPWLIFIFLAYGGLMVEQCSDNRLHSATVGSNLRLVWCINCSVRKLYVTIQIVEWAFGFIIHALMLAEMIAKASYIPSAVL